MSDEKKTDWVTIVAVIVIAAAGIATLWAIFHYIIGFPEGAEVPQVNDKWHALGMYAVAVAIAFAVMAMLRFAAAPLIAPKPIPGIADADTAVRSRIGPLVLLIGTTAVAVLAMALIIAFALLAKSNQAIETKADVLLSGVFNTVLPVVATWVGTVLAFYFGSENFRQAREAFGDQPTAKKKVTDVMIPYDRIARMDWDVTKVADVEKLSMIDVINSMSAAAPRIIVFDKNSQTPIYVIRSKTPPMPDKWITPNYEKGSSLPDDPTKTPPTITLLKDYLDANGGQNRKDATNFDFMDENATIDAALQLMDQKQIDDLFITRDGQKTSKVVGWVAKQDLLKKK
jgi:hypothetical protein